MDKKDTVRSIIGEKKLTVKEKIGPAAVIFIIFITGILFMRPAIGAIIRNTAKLQENKEKLSHLQAKKSALKSYQTQEQEVVLDDQLKLISRYIPSSKPSLQALISLVSLSRAESLEFSGVSLNPGAVKSKKSGTNSPTRIAEDEERSSQVLDSFDIAFSVTGKKASLESFVSKLKELAPMMRIEKFSTSFIKDEKTQKVALDNQDLMLVVQLNLKVYFQTVPDKLPAITEPLPLLTKEEEELVSNLKNYVYATSEIPTVESLGQGGDLGNQSPFMKSLPAPTPAR